MKKIIVVFSFLCFSLLSQAQIKQIWECMPDSFLPYLTESQRTELADYADMHMSAEVQNALGEKTKMDTLTADFLQLRSNNSMLLQLRLLPFEGGDSLLCMVQTFYGPEPESSISFYNREWKPQDGIFIPSMTVDSFLCRPDTMTMNIYAEIKSTIDPFLYSATLSVADNSILLTCSLPQLSDDELKAVKPLIRQRKLKWSGYKYN